MGRHIKVLEQKEDLPVLLAQLEDAASLFAEGHYTLMAFSTNWRCMLGTPDDRWDIVTAPEGKTANEAIRNCLEDCNFAQVSRLKPERQAAAIRRWSDKTRQRADEEERSLLIEYGFEYGTRVRTGEKESASTGDTNNE